MTYQDFQQKRSKWREKELQERQEDIASPRPPLNNSITDQAIRELLDRVAALEARIAKPTPTAQPFGLPADKK